MSWDTGDKCDTAEDCSWADEFTGSTIYLAPKVQAVIRKLCDDVKTEWQMMLTGRETKDGVYVTGYWIPKQEVTPATVTNLDIVSADVIKQRKIVCTIHSHANMGVFFSGIDEKFTNNSLIKNHIVVNNHGKMKACMRYELPCKMTKFFEASVTVVTPKIDEVIGVENIVEKKYMPTTPYSSRGWYGTGGYKSKGSNNHNDKLLHAKALNRDHKNHAITEEVK